MPERWSIAQVLALAPDASSLPAARSSARAPGWSGTGHVDHLVWGLCRGSGRNPYQVCVDLEGPAYRCSCPSRKVPCKHALGLLLRWAGGSATDHTDPPPWVTEWQQDRAARSVRGPAPRAAPADPVAAARRTRQRAERVAGGMGELRRWLDDQVGQGLAAAGQSGHGPYEAMAARLVDAQAPTAAGAVRRLGRFVGIGPHWADRLLGELALLRLLVTAHDRLDTLAPGLAATVRTRIGFPIGTAEVLAGPAVRDDWQVLGQVDTDDGAISTRRTWLHGAGTGRFALLLAFAAPGEAFGSDVVPGTRMDAALCFYPAALPMRAVLAERYGVPEPLSAPSGATGVTAALRGYSAGLAAEPWRDRVPVLLAAVAPTDDGHLVDASGDALPLAPGHREPWWLLAATGAWPATVAAEWSPDGLRPLATWADGRYVPATPGAPGWRDRSPELPADLLTAALVGTARRRWSGRSVPVGDRELSLAPAGGDTGPGAELLDAAATALVYRRAATTPATGHQPVAPAPADLAREVPPAAAARLRLLLGEGGAPGGAHATADLLAQWLQAAAGKGGVVVPGDTLPPLLDAGRRTVAIRPALARVAGVRGRWLAERRPEWHPVLEAFHRTAGTTAPVAHGGSADVDVWESGTPTERITLLERLRHSDPAAGRELLAGTFATESADDRARFLEVLATGLSEADDDLLERALDDRRSPVRAVALSLLRRLPASSYARRMAARARACVRCERLPPGDRLPPRDRLVVTPPRQVDAALRRDGLPPQPPAGIGIGAWLLEEIVAGTPLDTWTAVFDRAPAAILELATGDDFATPLLHGWARAATAHRDAAWAGALVAATERARPGRPGGLPQELAWDLHLVLPPAELARFAAEALRTDPARAHRLLAVSGDPWSDELAVAVIESIARRARSDQHAWQLAELCRFAATAMPVHYAASVSRLTESLQSQAVDHARVRPVAELAAMLTFRHDMIQELT